jgi:uncharacterized damage-inducible protein DinB
MDILDRLLKHDLWTTRQLLVRCRELTPEQFDRRFDIGHGSLRETFAHMIGNIGAWTDLMRGRPVRPRPESKGRAESVEGLIERLEAGAADFGSFARQVAGEGRLDEFWTDVLDNPPTKKTFGGAIAHVITHNMAHRTEVLHMLQRLGVQDLIEGDVLSWEKRELNKSSEI